MLLTFEPDKTFDVPEGTFLATLDKVCEKRKVTKEGVVPYARFLWRIDSLCTETKTAMAGKDYPPALHESSDLRLMLENWLGKEWIEQQQKSGKFDTDSLKERKATLVIRHIKNSSHKKPFRNVEQVLPVGTVLPQPTP